MTRNIQDEIKALLQQHPIVLFMKGKRHLPMCGFSAATVAVLEELNVPFHDINVLEDPDIREGIKQFADWPTIPQLYLAGEFIGGCDIVREMHANGSLKTLVQKALEQAA